jgi:hypothetical protein
VYSQAKPVTCDWFLASGFWLLVAGCWLLVAGYWSLVTGHWLLVTCHWFLVAGFRDTKAHMAQGARLKV